MVTKEQKAAIIAEYGKTPEDSGSANVQVALLTAHVRDLTEHLKAHPKDFHSRRGLHMMLGQRRRLLAYIKKNDINEYRELIKSLGLRDILKNN